MAKKTNKQTKGLYAEGMVSLYQADTPRPFHMPPRSAIRGQSHQDMLFGNPMKLLVLIGSRLIVA